MADRYLPPDWFPRPESPPYWMPDLPLGYGPTQGLPSNVPWNRTPVAGPPGTMPAASSGGILGNLVPRSDEFSLNGGLLGGLLPPIEVHRSTTLPMAPLSLGMPAPTDERRDPNSLFWPHTLAPFSAAAGGASNPDGLPTHQDAFERAAARSVRSVRPEGGRQEGAATHALETYVPLTARGIADLLSLPGRAPVPMPKGLQVNDAGEWLINGEPAVETAEGRAWLEDQQQRMDWGPAMAMLLAMGRAASIRTRATRAAAPSPIPETLPQPRPVPARSPESGRLFDYSRLHETPDVPQFDLERYVPPRGVPERVQAVANPATVERLNEAVRRGAERGGREFYNTEPLREAFIGELGPERGQAAYGKYLNLVGATSPRSEVGANIRNAAYHYMRSQQGFPPPVVRWDGERWRLAEPPPFPWGHLEQGLHAKKIGEVLAQGDLSPLTNQKAASFVENLRGNQRPVTIDRHNTRLLGVKGLHGRPVDAPPSTGYGFLERLQQEEAAKHGMTPAQYQGSAWIGGAEQTGVRSRLAPWLDTFEARVALTAKKLELKPEEVLRRFIRGEIPLWSLGGAATAGMGLAPKPEGDADE